MSEAWELSRKHGVRIGTASWTDPTLLKSGWFPKGASAEDRLRFYAEHFPIVEVDATYYALPSEKTAQAWNERTPDDFVFNIKAFGLFTNHPVQVKALPPDVRPATDKTKLYRKDFDPDVVDDLWNRFKAALAPIKSKLGVVLLQYPEWFTPSRANRDYILECRDRLDGRCAIEFRNKTWMDDPDRTLGFLRTERLPLVCVDMPQGFASSMPPIAEATSPDVAVVRFHGRDRHAWGASGVSAAERFKYDYTPAELSEWNPRVHHLADGAREVHTLMNNCYSDYAVRSARTMAGLLLDELGDE